MYQLANSLSPSNPSEHGSTKQLAKKKWPKLQVCHIKTNWDAAVNSNNSTGLGGLDCDSEGEVLTSFCSKSLSTMQPEAAEAMVLRKGAIVICWDLGLSNIIFKGDYCLQKVKVVNANKPTDDVLGPILLDIQYIIYRNQGWQVSHVNHEANDCAHSLAKFSFNIVDESIWIEDCLPCIRNKVMKEKYCTERY